ncbi:MAG TPA: phosphate-starvation-inducible PsiE family protein [Coriobacteriia bacterium]
MKRDSVIDVMDVAVVWIEGLVAALLVVLAGWGVVSLVAAIVDLLRGGPAFDFDRYISVLDVALVIFIIVELFRIAVAYLRHADVIPTVLEAGLVAVARKLVTFDTHAAATDVLMKAGALTLLLLAVGVTWYLLAKRNPSLLDPSGE